MGPTITMASIREHATEHGCRWFEPGATRFFRSRYPRSAVLLPDGRAAFVTSEQPPHGPRRYTVRAYDYTDGMVETVGPFCGYSSRREAQRAIADML